MIVQILIGEVCCTAWYRCQDVCVCVCGQEKAVIMSRMSGAECKVEEVRQRQNNKLRDRQEKKKAQQSRDQQQADALCLEATALQQL